MTRQRIRIKLARCGSRITLLAVFFLFPLTVHAQTGSVETVQFQSKLTNATLPYNVILPPDYRASSATRYPVLYLLHGYDGHYTDWLTRTNIADYAAKYRMIVVMPEGNNSWYANESRTTQNYELYMVIEVIPDVDKRYRTIQARYGRAIAGLSMGGYGAIKFGLKYPNAFVFAASLSGAFGATRYTQNEIGGAERWEAFLKVFGPVGSETRKANDVFELARAMSPSRIASLPYFYFDCGTEDAPQHFNANRELSELFLEKKIPHEYRELPGDHNWAYWDQQVPEVLQLAAQKLRLPRGESRGTKKPPRRK